MRVPVLAILAVIIALLAVAVPAAAYEFVIDTATTHIWFDLPRYLSCGRDGSTNTPAHSKVTYLNENHWPDILIATDSRLFAFLDVGQDEIDRRVDSPLAIDGIPSDIEAGDLDGDGYGDVVLAMSYEGIAVLKGDGLGGFAAPETYPWPGTHGVAVADLDGDGDLDVVATSSASRGLLVMSNAGDGTLTSVLELSNGSASGGIVALDVTEDGRPDLITTNAGPGRLACWVNLGGFHFALVSSDLDSTRSGWLYGSDFAGADLDADGHIDLVMAIPDGGQLLYGNGKGEFRAEGLSTPWACYPPGHNLSNGIAITDLDGDGRLDLVLAADGCEGYGGAEVPFGVVRPYLNLGGHTFEAQAGYHSVGEIEGLNIADLDLDGRQEIVAAGELPGGYPAGATVLRTRVDGRLNSLAEYPLPDVPDTGFEDHYLRARTIRLGGPRDDLVFNGAHDLYLMANTRLGSFDAPKMVGRGAPEAIRDFDGDGVEDVIIARADTIELLRGANDHTLLPADILLTGWRCMAVGNFDHDPMPDLFVSNPEGKLFLAPGTGGGSVGVPAASGASLQLRMTPPFDVLRQVACAVDLNHDGVDELVLFTNSGIERPPNSPPWPDSLIVIRRTAPDVWSAAARYAVPSAADNSWYGNPFPGRLIPADFDGDGWPDILAFRPALGDYLFHGDFAVLMNRGGGVYSEGTAIRVPHHEPNDVAVADLNGDHRDDVLISAINSSYTGALAWWLSNGDGTFTSGSRNDLGDYLTSLAVGRFDDDQRPDVAVMASRPRFVGVIMNTTAWPAGTTPVLASLVSASIDAGVARITWSTDAAPAIEAVVLRSLDGDAWSERARLHPDGDGRVRFEDAALTPGQRVGYRLAFGERGTLVTASETWLEVPLAARLALAGARPNPVAGDLMVVISLAHRTPGTLALFDLAGRRVAEQDVGALDAGEHRIRLAEAGAVRPGLYFIRLVTPERTLTTRAIVVS